MSKVKTTVVSEEVAEKVTAYVHKNYKAYVGKSLIVTENNSAFFVFKHKDGGPLVLGKGILG